LILADTSVWIDHLRSSNRDLQQLLNQGQVAIHPFVIAELALGSLRERQDAGIAGSFAAGASGPCE
jgi:predicted nucleic acid-binding protein